MANPNENDRMHEIQQMCWSDPKDDRLQKILRICWCIHETKLGQVSEVYLSPQERLVILLSVRYMWHLCGIRFAERISGG
jgi:hypothetical protein